MKTSIDNTTATIDKLVDLGMTDYQNVDLTDLVVDDTYQRGLSDRRVRTIGDNWSWLLYEPILVNVRTDGTLAVVDGHHRVAGARRAGLAGLPAYIVFGLTVAQEAEVFAKRGRAGTVVKLRSLELWRARYYAEEPKVLAIMAIMQAHDLTVSWANTAKFNAIRAIRAVENIFDRDGAEGLDRTLGVLVRAWDGEPDSLQESLLLGVSLFLRLYPEADEDRLVAKLRERSPLEIIRRISGLVTTGVRGRRYAAAQAIYDVYNYRKQVRLPAEPLARLGVTQGRDER